MSGHNYLIISAGELEKIDFDELEISSAETLIFSKDNSKTFIEWDKQEPTCLAKIIWKDGPYSKEQMIEILGSSEWYQRG